MAGPDHLQLEISDHVATLTINRPSESNSLLPETFNQLGEFTERLAADPKVWVIILQGEGAHFSIGVDIEVIRQLTEMKNDSFVRDLRAMQLALDAFEGLQKPVIAKLHGFCMGGGLMLALCCDFRVASGRTFFGFPEVKRGIPVIMGTHRLTRTIGPAAAKEMIYLGKLIKAETALELGLVHKVVSQDDLDRSVERLAGQFLKLPPRTVSAVKRIFQEGDSLSLRESQELEIQVQVSLMDSPDMREALQSFLDKRSPEFKGS
jgi:enoyl-CoA hydratase/carnithine racemase